jgi:hypothetical protein
VKRSAHIVRCWRESCSDGAREGHLKYHQRHWIPACAHCSPEDFGAGFLDSATGQFIDFDKEKISENIQRHWIPAYAGMTVVVVATVKFPPSSRRKPGSSVFRCKPEKILPCVLNSMNSRIKLCPIPGFKNLPDSSGPAPG